MSYDQISTQQHGVAATSDLTPPPRSSPVKHPPSSHRLHSVSAAEAFQNLSDNQHGLPIIPTGLPALDEALGGGVEVGKVTELWGPVGAGKTAISLALAVTAAKTNSTVLWLDIATPLCPTRIPSDLQPSLTRIAISTLPHLLALLLHPPPTFPAPRTSLLILPSLHLLLEASHPRNPSHPVATAVATQKWAQGRRYAILGNLTTALNRIAVLHNLAVLVLTGCATRMRGPGTPLGLVPGLGGSEWESGVWNRVVVFRDFGGRYASVQKARGSQVASSLAAHGLGDLVPFDIGDSGHAVHVYTALTTTVDNPHSVLRVSPVRPSPPALSRKRAFDEIADSDDDEEGVDEYGNWVEVEEDIVLVAETTRNVTGIDDAS